jgi:hypothetical protein
MPPFAAACFTKTRAERGAHGGGYTRTQEFVALLHWFTTFPLEVQLEIVRRFEVHLASQDQTKTDRTRSA